MYFLCKDQKDFEKRKKLVNNILVYLDDKDTEESLKFIKNKIGNPLGTMWSLSLEYEAKASLGWLELRNKNDLKKNCYIAGKLNILRKSRKDWGGSGYNVSNFFKILMSDNKNLSKFLIKNIDIICYESKPNYHKGIQSNLFLNKTTLLALKGDWENLKKRSNIFLNDIPKDMKKRILDFEFFQGLAEKNIDKMKEALNKLLIPKNAKIAAYDTEAYFDFYLQVQVLMYGKIASIHGYDLGIDHELAPKELIKYDPLPDGEYEDPYDFMKEFDYNAPQSEWIEKYSPKD
ncbi:Imm49 family immunity protein [Fusobacterium varium]